MIFWLYTVIPFTSSLSRDIPPELQGVSVKDLVKAIGESRANGNGATPPRTPPATPKRLSRSSSPRAVGVGPSGNVGVISGSGTSPRQISRSSSPVPIPGMHVRYFAHKKWLMIE